MKATQQKNCTKPTFQNADGALRNSVIQSDLSWLPSPFAAGSGVRFPLYSAYSCGFHSFTFSVV